MNSAINLLGTSSQTSGNQINKTMHSQGSTTSYGEPSHLPQSVGSVHTNTNAAHSHPNQHHYSLGVSNTAGHYINQNSGQIPASNHPVANPSSTAAGQGYSPQKNISNYMSSHEDNISPQPNQTAYLPVNQTLPASVSSQPNVSPGKPTSENVENQSDKPQSNGTSEVKLPQKNDTTSGVSLTPKEKSIQPAPVPQLSQVQENAEENLISGPTPILTQMQQLKPSETTNPKVLLLPPATNSKPLSSICLDSQHTEASPATVISANSIPSACIGSSDDSASSAVETLGEPEIKKVKVDGPSLEQVENVKKNKPTESDKKSKIENGEPSNMVDPTEPSEEKDSPKEKICSKEESLPKAIPATSTPIETPTKSSTRKAKQQATKLDDSAKPVIKDSKVSFTKSPSVSKVKRQRIRTQPYQSPLPEVELISKISSLTPRTPRNNDDKLTVFYKNEFLAVRNAEGSFYLCQTVQNIYKSSSKIKIRWLSQDKSDKSGELYTPDFYDLTDFDCILTNLSLDRIDKRTFRLPPTEKDRTQSILNRSLAVEKGEVTSPSLTEEHPDGLDLSLYRDEDQLKKRGSRKRKAGRKPSNVSITEKKDSVKKSPEDPKVQKATTHTKTPAKNTMIRKVQPLKKSTTQPEVKTPAFSSKRVPSRGKRKTDNTTIQSPVVDQKKAKVLAKIGRKAAIPAAKSVQSSAKNAKSGTKGAASSKKSTQIKTSLSAAVKPPPRNARRTTRK